MWHFLTVLILKINIYYPTKQAKHCAGNIQQRKKWDYETTGDLAKIYK